VGPPGACPFDFLSRRLQTGKNGYLPAVYLRQGGNHMPMWLLVLLIVLLVLLVFGGVGYGRRGV
jgi:hypothetical protein